MSTTETKVTHTTYGITIPQHPAAQGPYTNVPGYHIYERLSEGCIGNQIAFVYNANGTDENAQRIVRAVNSHADMLEALEAADELIHVMLTGTDVDIFSERDTAKAWQKSVRAIVAKAKGGAA